MKIFSVLVISMLSVFAIVVQSRPQSQPSNNAEIVLYDAGSDDNGYDFKYETSDGIARSEKGELKPASQPGETQISVEGSYVYTNDLGKEVRVRYKADEFGFRIIPNNA